MSLIPIYLTSGSSRGSISASCWSSLRLPRAGRATLVVDIAMSLSELMMFARRTVCLILLCMSTSTTLARPDIRACWERASKDADLYPMQIDKDTTVIGTSCREESSRPIYIYQNQLIVERSAISPATLSQQKIQSLRMACSDPNVLPLLKLIDMEYAFYDKNMTYIGRYTLRIEDCN